MLGRGTGFFSYISAQHSTRFSTLSRNISAGLYSFGLECFIRKQKLYIYIHTYTFIFLFNFSTSPASSTIRIQLGMTLYLPGNNVTLSLGLAWKLPVACLRQAVMVMGVTYPSGSFFFLTPTCATSCSASSVQRASELTRGALPP